MKYGLNMSYYIESSSPNSCKKINWKYLILFFYTKILIKENETFNGNNLKLDMAMCLSYHIHIVFVSKFIYPNSIR